MGHEAVPDVTKEKPTHVELQAATVDLLKVLGYQYLTVRRSLGYRKGQGAAHMTTTNIKGWPDITCWKPGQPGVKAIEVKIPPDRLRPEQKDVLTSLDSSGVECFVVRPGDLPELARLLTGLSDPEVSALRWPPRSTLIPDTVVG